MISRSLPPTQDSTPFLIATSLFFFLAGGTFATTNIRVGVKNSSGSLGTSVGSMVVGISDSGVESILIGPGATVDAETSVSSVSGGRRVAPDTHRLSLVYLLGLSHVGFCKHTRVQGPWFDG